MIQFVCDTCSAVKDREQTWIVGSAAETTGATSARREVNIQSAWTRLAAVHPLAVHFCSIQCKDEYLARLFAGQTTLDEADAIGRTKAEGNPVSAKPTVRKIRKTAHKRAS